MWSNHPYCKTWWLMLLTLRAISICFPYFACSKCISLEMQTILHKNWAECVNYRKHGYLMGSLSLLFSALSTFYNTPKIDMKYRQWSYWVFSTRIWQSVVKFDVRICFSSKKSNFWAFSPVNVQCIILRNDYLPLAGTRTLLITTLSILLHWQCFKAQFCHVSKIGRCHATKYKVPDVFNLLSYGTPCMRLFYTANVLRSPATDTPNRWGARTVSVCTFTSIYMGFYFWAMCISDIFC